MTLEEAHIKALHEDDQRKLARLVLSGWTINMSKTDDTGMARVWEAVNGDTGQARRHFALQNLIDAMEAANKTAHERYTADGAILGRWSQQEGRTRR